MPSHIQVEFKSGDTILVPLANELQNLDCKIQAPLLEPCLGAVLLAYQLEGNNVTDELIQKLPSKYKEVILLFYYKELSYEEISEILKISEGTVRSRLSRARQKLKKMMNESPIF